MLTSADSEAAVRNASPPDELVPPTPAKTPRNARRS
jgi:hypothetical protein